MYWTLKSMSDKMFVKLAIQNYYTNVIIQVGYILKSLTSFNRAFGHGAYNFFENFVHKCD